MSDETVIFHGVQTISSPPLWLCTCLHKQLKYLAWSWSKQFDTPMVFLIEFFTKVDFGKISNFAGGPYMAWFSRGSRLPVPPTPALLSHSMHVITLCVWTRSINELKSSQIKSMFYTVSVYNSDDPMSFKTVITVVMQNLFFILGLIVCDLQVH